MKDILDYDSRMNDIKIHIIRGRVRMKLNKSDNKKGFTLVELIVVLVILAILAAILIPTLTGYIEKAREKKLISEARGLFVAAQATISEHAVNADFKSSLIQSGAGKEKYGRVTNYMLYMVQNSKKADNNAVHIAIAEQVLKYLDSADKKTATYKMNNSHNPLGIEVSAYEKQYKQPGIIICYDAWGRVVFVEFGSDGMLVHMDSDGTITVTKNGVFSRYPEGD